MQCDRNELSRTIEHWEEKLRHFSFSHPLWYVLAHARREWAFGNYEQANKDIKNLDHAYGMEKV